MCIPRSNAQIPLPMPSVDLVDDSLKEEIGNNPIVNLNARMFSLTKEGVSKIDVRSQTTYTQHHHLLFPEVAPQPLLPEEGHETSISIS